MAPKRDEDAGDTRTALLAAARRLFGRDGYAGTSVQAIVEAAGVTKGAFYHHFDNKEEIFLRVFADVQREIGRRSFVVHVEERSATHDSNRPGIRDLSAESNEEVWAHVLEGCRAYLDMHTDPAVQRIVLLDGRAVLSWAQQQQARTEHAVVLLRADLRRAMARHIIRPLPLPLLATMLAGSLDEACIAIANSDDQAAAVDEAMQVVEALLSGLYQG